MNVSPRLFVIFLFAIQVLLFEAPASAEFPTFSLTDAGGKSQQGKLVSLSNSELRIQSGNETLSFPLTELMRATVRLSQPTAFVRRSLILLANGDRIYGQPIGFEDELLQVSWSAYNAWAVARIPLESVQGMIVNFPQTASQQRELLRSVKTLQPKSDVVLLKNDDQLRGEFSGADLKTLTLETAAGETTLSQSALKAIVMNSELISFPAQQGPQVMAILRDGSRITGQISELGEDGLLNFVPAWGGKLQLPIASVESLHFLGGKAVYLSDLKPSQYEFTPWLNYEWDWKADQNVVGGVLQLGEQSYFKGIGMHSRSRLTFDLEEKYTLLHATIGIDASTQGKGSVIFRVFLDSKEVYKSPLLTGKSQPVQIPPVVLSNASTLTLEVDFGEFGDILDRANWCEIWLTKP